MTTSQCAALYQYTSTNEIKKAPIVEIGAVYITLRFYTVRLMRHRRNDDDQRSHHDAEQKNRHDADHGCLHGVRR
ncbi:hypothetical protein MC62_019200 [Citrobacter freundii]|nr:hypothetical protein MC62_019200 [Citrobacter freundii]AYL43976.1 hypothetical protein CUC45_17800 [Citrobacter freundii]